MTFWKWSKTAASNGTADSTCAFPEGMSASALNDGTRGMMAAAAKFRDDISGAIVTSGTSTAYTVFSNQGFDALSSLNGQMVAFTPHATNDAIVTLNVDSLGAKPLRPSPGVELPAGSLILGTPYLATYNNSDAAWYLHGGGSAYGIPLGGGIDYWLPTAPNSAFAFPFGQAISRTTYAPLFAAMGTTFGVGDGSTTFNLPDKRGRVSAGIDNMGGSAAGQFTGVGFSSGNSTTPGSKLGIVTQTIGQGQLPNIAPTFTGTAYGNLPVTGAGGNPLASTGLGAQVGTGGGNTGVPSALVVNVPAPVGVISSLNGNVTQTALPTVQPTILANYILRII